MTLGVIINPRAGRMQRRPDWIDRLARVAGDRPVEVPAADEEIRPALEALRDEAVSTVAIVGGDGSVTGTLTPLVETWAAVGRELPRVALLPGGSVNTIPHALGRRGTPAHLLQRLLDPECPRLERRLSTLRIRPDAGAAGARSPVPVAHASRIPQARVGMIFGTGAVSRWLESYYATPRRGTLGAALGVGTALGSILRGGALSRHLFQPFEAKVEVDGVALPAERFTAMAAGALEQIGLGFRPFHQAGRQPGRFHWISTSAGPRSMGLEVLNVALRLRSRLSRLDHASATRVEIRSPEPLPYTVDGDLFPATHGVEVSAGPEIRFLAC